MFAKCAVLLLLCSPASYANENSLSFNGYTGLFHVPAATTLAHGMSAYQMSDQLFVFGENRHANNVSAHYGLLPGLEVSGRIAWLDTQSNLFVVRNAGPRDLSASVKFRIPFIPENWLALAVGIEDLGGQNSLFNTKYIVASKDFDVFSAHFGAATIDKRNSALDKRLDGQFFGVSTRPWHGLQLIAEYNGDYTNAGLKAYLPVNFLMTGASLQASFMMASSETNAAGENVDKTFGALALSIPLGGSFGRRSLKQAKYYSPNSTSRHAGYPQRLNRARPRSELIATAPDAALQGDGKILESSSSVSQTAGLNSGSITIAPSKTESSSNLSALAVPPVTLSKAKFIVAQLEKVGFSDIDVGYSSTDQLWLRFENKVFNRNYIDAVGLVAGAVCKQASLDQSVVLVLTQQRIPVQEITFSPQACRSVLSNDGSPLYLPTAQPVKDKSFETITVLAAGAKSLRFKPRITASPSLSNGVATEFGVVDYSVGVYSNIAVNLARGLMVSAAHISVLDESQDYQRGGPFFGARLREGSNEWNIQQTFTLGPYVWNTLHYGRFGKFYRGVFDHVNLISHDGRHRLTYRYGNFEHENNPADKRNVRISSYRYYMQKYDFSIEYFYGKFFSGDTGHRLDTTFWFGDTAVGLYYRNTEAEFVGIRWTLPLSFRKDNNNHPILFGGREAWNYQLQTRINEDANILSFSVASIPKWNWEPERLYLNNDRSGAAYIRRHAHRLQEAYQTYQHLLD